MLQCGLEVLSVIDWRMYSRSCLCRSSPRKVSVRPVVVVEKNLR